MFARSVLMSFMPITALLALLAFLSGPIDAVSVRQNENARQCTEECVELLKTARAKCPMSRCSIQPCGEDGNFFQCSKTTMPPTTTTTSALCGPSNTVTSLSQCPSECPVFLDNGGSGPCVTCDTCVGTLTSPGGLSGDPICPDACPRKLLSCGVGGKSCTASLV